MPFALAVCSDNLFHMFICFSVKKFGSSFLFYLSFPEFSVLSLLVGSLSHTYPPTHTRSVKWQCADRCHFNTWVLERAAVVSELLTQVAVPRTAGGDCLACGLGLCSRDRHSVAVWLTKCLLSPQVSAAHMVREWNGNRPTELPKGPRGSWQKAKHWRAQWVHLLAQRKTQELEICLN